MRKDASKDQILGHGDEADGIEEYDNALPDWWMGLFWVTIVWAVLYGVHYHFVADRSQVEELAAEMAAAETRWPASAAAPVDLATLTPELAARGEAVFQSTCTGCHGATMEGGIGPNLKDEVWLHGGQPEEILRTVTEGVPAKGMPAWGGILGPEKVRQVTAYIVSQQGE